MKRKATLFLAGLAAAFTLGASVASAQPIELFTDQVSKLKFVNYEKILDTNGNGFWEEGEKVTGIINMEAITNLTGSQDLSAQLSSRELTGQFTLTVAGTWNLDGTPALGGFPIFPLLGTQGHVDFRLDSGDSIDLYVGTGATKNWDPAALDAITRATDGALWASVTGGTGFGYEGSSDTVVIPVIGFSETTNKNWADLDVNNTGYPILKEFYPSAGGELLPIHFSNGAIHPEHFVDVFFASRLFLNTDAATLANGWNLRSEDPIYIHATPEPGTFLLFGSGLVGLGFAARKRFKK